MHKILENFVPAEIFQLRIKGEEKGQNERRMLGQYNSICKKKANKMIQLETFATFYEKEKMTQKTGSQRIIPRSSNKKTWLAFQVACH